MNTPAGIQSSETSTEISKGIAARAAQIGVSLLLQGLVLFLSAGRLGWIWAWAYLGIYITGIAINAAFMFRSARETIAERGRPKEMKAWDKTIGGLWGLVHFLVIPFIAGLDVRFDWSGAWSLAAHLAGAGLFAAGMALFSWAMITNAFFSTTVRIQSDRGHTVCRSGPYRFVRHPGYVGAILQALGLPLLLGSLWALVPAGLACGLMVARTALEDQTLQAGLPGYQEFAREVRYRLLPGIW